MKTMIAKYSGQCAVCQMPIAKGQSINFFGRGRAEHEECSKVRADKSGPDRFDMQVEDNMRDTCGC